MQKSKDKDRLTADRYSKTKVLSGLARLCSGVTYAPVDMCDYRSCHGNDRRAW